VTDEIDAVVARMRKGAVRFPAPLKKEEWGSMAKFADPDGNIFWLIEAPRSLVRGALTSRAPGPKRAGPKRRPTVRKR
jgi:hypothetical protein